MTKNGIYMIIKTNEEGLIFCVKVESKEEKTLILFPPKFTGGALVPRYLERQVTAKTFPLYEFLYAFK